MNELDRYLKDRHLKDCMEIGEILTEYEWVNEVLNKRLPANDKLAYPSVNQWMKGDRMPDLTNILRLIKVFGPEVMPYVGIEMKPDLLRLIDAWPNLGEDTKSEIFKLARNSEPNGELAPVAA